MRRLPNLLLLSFTLPLALPAHARTLTVTLTAYHANGRRMGCCDTGRYTRSGHIARPGHLAVDKSLIPLGSRITILRAYKGRTGHLPARWVGRTYRARDTGRAIRGARMDLCVGSHAEAMRIGRVRVKVEVRR